MPSRKAKARIARPARAARIAGVQGDEGAAVVLVRTVGPASSTRATERIRVALGPIDTLLKYGSKPGAVAATDRIPGGSERVTEPVIRAAGAPSTVREAFPGETVSRRVAFRGVKSRGTLTGLPSTST